MSDYKEYEEQRVRVKETGEEGEAFESALGFISVFLDGNRNAKYFKIDEVEFL
jgi:hypothetical protein